MSDELVTYLRSLQTEPGTIFVGFSPITEFSQEDRAEYLRQTREGNPGRAIMVIEVATLAPDEILMCEPDDADEPLSYSRASKR
jgi:hypothetical protein